MELTIDNIIMIVTAVGGIAGTIFTQKKYRDAKDNLVDVIGDVSNLLAMVYEVSKSGTCTPDQMKLISKKIEEIWTELADLGPTFASLLEDKADLAKVLSKSK